MDYQEYYEKTLKELKRVRNVCAVRNQLLADSKKNLEALILLFQNQIDPERQKEINDLLYNIKNNLE